MMDIMEAIGTELLRRKDTSRRMVFRHPPRDIKALFIKVSEETVPRMALRGNARAHAKARWLFTVLATDLLGASPCQIGKVMNKDPSGVSHGLKQGRDLTRANPHFRRQVNRITEWWFDSRPELDNGRRQT